MTQKPFEPNASHVRLVTGEWPDFEMEDTDGKTHRFEAVEADLPGRQRGDEYAEAAERRWRGENVWRGFTPEDAERGNQQVEVALRRATERKVGKAYAGRCNLVILLNFGGEFGWGASEVKSILHSGTEPAREVFEKIWILWKKRAFLLWREGGRVAQAEG